MNFLDSLVFQPVGRLRYALRACGASDGQPLLLLHGLLDTSASFAAIVHAIEARRPGRYRFIAPDWRGHGASDHVNASYWFPEYLADLDAIVDTVLDADAPRPVALVGHSMGGQIASQYAGLRASRVSHLVTLDSLNVPDADTDQAVTRYRRWLDARTRPPSNPIHDSVDAIAARIGQRYPELDADQLEFLAREWSAPADNGRRRVRFDAWHRVPFPYGFRLGDAMAIWREVSADVLCIDAADSQAGRYVDDQDMARRRACFRKARHVVLPDCGHMLHLQRPAAVAEAICNFADL